MLFTSATTIIIEILTDGQVSLMTGLVFLPHEVLELPLRVSGELLFVTQLRVPREKGVGGR